MSEKPYLSIVIPCYNEAESLPQLYHEIQTACDPLKKEYEILFIDDGSTDGTFNLLRDLNKKDTRIKVIQFRKNAGKSDALSVGFEAATGDLVVTMDADLQDDPAEIPNLIAKLDNGYDMISGWKKKRRDPLSKKIPSKVWNAMTTCMTGMRLHDYNCGLKIYRSEVIKTIRVFGELHRYLPVLADLQGFQVGELPVNHRPRQFGKTKFGISRFTNGFFDLLTVVFIHKYTKRPLHLFGLIGLVSTLLGSGITLYLILLRIFKASYLSNRPLLFIGVMLLILGVQFISIGLLGEMITRSSGSTEKKSIRQTLGL